MTTAVNDIITFLRNSRIEISQTQPWLGQQLGESAERVAGWEKGEGSPTLKKLERWAELFGCEVTLKAQVEPKVRRRDYGALSVFGSPVEAPRSIVSARELLLGKGAP